MAKDVISVNGEDTVVREDTAKSYRGVIWALASLAIFIVILAVLFLGGFLTQLTGGNVDTPAEAERNAGR
jgi:hypothetical protein